MLRRLYQVLQGQSQARNHRTTQLRHTNLIPTNGQAHRPSTLLPSQSGLQTGVPLLWRRQVLHPLLGALAPPALHLFTLLQTQAVLVFTFEVLGSGAPLPLRHSHGSGALLPQTVVLSKSHPAFTRARAHPACGLAAADHWLLPHSQQGSLAVSVDGLLFLVFRLRHHTSLLVSPPIRKMPFQATDQKNRK